MNLKLERVRAPDLNLELMRFRRWVRRHVWRKPEPVFCTISTRHFLPWSLVLFDALSRHHPRARRLLLYVGDSLGDTGLPVIEGSEVIGVAALVEQPLEAMLRRRYSASELCFSLKPRLLRYALDRLGSSAIYLDSDIDVLGPLDAAAIALGSASAVVTPHLDTAIPLDGKRPSDLTILRAGSFNLGFIGVSECAEARGLLGWWDQRVQRWGFVAPERAYQGDQKWMDLAPALFRHLHILRDAGSNVGYWNLHSREVTERHGRLFARAAPLAFVHFSGFDPEHPEVLSRFQDRISEASMPILMACARDFAQRVRAAGDRATALSWRGAENRPPAASVTHPETPLAVLSDAGYRARFEPRHEGGSFETGEEAVIEVRVTNDSPEQWRADIGIGISWHLYGEHGDAIGWNNPRIYLPHEVEPGASWDATLAIRMPDVPGRYRVEIDLVHELVAWFADKGNPTASVVLPVGKS